MADLSKTGNPHRVNRRLLAVSALTIALLALVGCFGRPGSRANRAPGAESSTGAEPGNSGGGSAPRVPSPLKTSSITSDACTALSASARADLGLGEGSPRSTPNGPSCTFQEEDDPGNQIDVTTVTANKNGLSDVYDTKSNDAYFGETQMVGYPVVYAAALDDRKEGRCGAFVGVTDELAVNILAQYDHGAGAADPCTVVQKFGEAMIRTLMS
jgi:hypothetical protein